MIVPDVAPNAVAVADHYDELDPVYRRVWGEHVHHGLWATNRETPAEAVEALVDTVGDRLRLRPGEACVDIGCGYGATARQLAVTREVRVTGFTLSAEQARYAAAHPVPGVDIRLGDWLTNALPDACAAAAWAIESSEHMEDKPGFFAEAHRVLAAAAACSRVVFSIVGARAMPEAPGAVNAVAARLRVLVHRSSLSRMNRGKSPRSEPNGRWKKSGSPASLPIAVVFFAIAVAMMFLGTTVWIAFFTMGVTFLIIGMQKPGSIDERPPGGTSRG